MDSAANSEVGGATAEISGHGFVDIGVGGVRVLSEQRGGGYNLSGLAVAALWDLFSDPGFLDQMQTVCGKTFDSDNSLAAALERVVWQERVAAPSMWTVQAPQSPMPQPYFVPVMLSRSRNAQSKGISGSASMVSCRLLISRANRVIVASRFKVQAPKGFLASGVQGNKPEMQGRLAMVQRICDLEQLRDSRIGSIPHAERWNYAWSLASPFL